MGMPKDKMTGPQQLFADLCISGMKPVDAYRRAYPNQSLSPNALRVESSRLRAHPKIQAVVAGALKERRSEVLLTRDSKRMILGEIAFSVNEKATARISAIHQDNLMTGDHKPVRIEGEITLYSIFEALVGTTGIPSVEEQRTLKQAVPVGPARTRKPAAEEPSAPTTAMERAG